MRPARVLALLLLSACDPKPDTGLPEVPPDTPPGLALDAPRDGEHFGPGVVVHVEGFTTDDVDAASELVLVVSSSLDGEVARPTVGDDGAFSQELVLSAGSHALTVTSTDSAGNVATAEVSILVDEPVVDGPPSPPAIHVEPLGAVTGDALSIVFDAPSVDPEGAPVSYRYRWIRGVDDTATEVSTEPTIPNGTIFRGETWQLTVWASDGGQESEPASETFLVGNAAPYAAGVAIGPVGALASDPLTCTVNGLGDLESDVVTTTYAWTVDGDAAGDGTATLAAGTVATGQEVVCTVTLDDGTDQALYISAPFELGNTAPSAPTLTIEPANPTDADDLVCVVTADAIDAEGDPVVYTYAWRVDGAATTYVTDTIPAADTTRDEVWTCTVTATDPGGLGTSTSVSATVGRAWEGAVAASDAWVTIDGAAASGAFGKTIALVGDTDGDGLSEVAVGANGENDQDGAVYLFAGADLTGPLTTADAVASWAGAYTDGQLGGFRSLAAPGDLDGDGAADLLFAAADADADGNGSGQVYLVYGGGSPGLDVDPTGADWLVTATAGDQVGARLNAGDLDGDGLTDLLVAAPSASDDGHASGTVGLWYGEGGRLSGQAALTDADWRVEGDSVGDGLGWTTRVVGDLDADGYDDFVVGAMYADPAGSESGVLGIVSGGARRSGEDPLADVNTARLSGDAAGDRFGYDAVGNVDLDADGIGDLLVAAYQDDTAAVDAGTVYAYLGSAAWSATLTPADADAAITGTSTAARFGHVMASPGDLDGDGETDLLIGALFDDPTGLTYQGAAYLLLTPDWSAVGADTDIAWRAAGEAAQDLFGDALSAGRGDVDGDGREDFAVGAQGYDGGASAAGRVYVWRGR